MFKPNKSHPSNSQRSSHKHIAATAFCLKCKKRVQNTQTLSLFLHPLLFTFRFFSVRRHRKSPPTIIICLIILTSRQTVVNDSKRTKKQTNMINRQCRARMWLAACRPWDMLEQHEISTLASRRTKVNKSLTPLLMHNIVFYISYHNCNQTAYAHEAFVPQPLG